MRPKGIIGLLVLVLIVGLLTFLIDDQWIENQLENIGTSIVGARVEIDRLDFSLLGLAISLDRLQVTNPNDTWKNLFETGRLAFDVDTKPLFKKKFIIDEITISRVRIGTKRQTDGRIPKTDGGSRGKKPGWLDKAVNSLKARLAQAPVLRLGTLKQKINVDSLLAITQIQTPDKINLTRLQIDSTYNKWQQIVSNFDPKKELLQVENQINQIKSQQIKGLDDLVKTATTVNNLYKTVNALKTDLENKKRRATEDFKNVRQTLTSVDNWLDEDFNRLISKAKLVDFSAGNVARMLFGNAITLPTIGLLRYVALLRQYMPVAQQIMQSGKVEKPPRFKGQDILFPVTDRLPKFLIKKIEISGESATNDTARVWYAGGVVQGITSHPSIYGQPMTVDLKVRKPGSNPYQLMGMFDHTGEIPRDRIQIKGFGLNLGELSLTNQPYLPSRLQIKKADLSADFMLNGNDLDFRINFTARPVNFLFEQEAQRNDRIARVLMQIFNSIQELKLSAGIQGPVESPDLHISSNIDNILSQRLKALAGESVKMARQEIKSRLHALVEPKKKEALNLLKDKQTKIFTQLSHRESLINEKLAFLENKKKEIGQAIKKEKKKGLEKVKKKLKKIFN